MIRVAEHRARVEREKLLAKERAERGLESWKQERERVKEAKIDIVKTLEKSSESWITDVNLEEAIESVVDDFMISSTQRTEMAPPAMSQTWSK